MHLTLFSSPLALFGISIPQLTGLLVPIAAFVFAGTIVISKMYFRNRRREMWHETARLALEKGQPLPPSPENESFRSSDSFGAAHDLRAGLILLATGTGLYLFLGTFISPGLAYVGAIPGFIGIALLVFGLLRLAFQKKSDSDPRSPKP